MLTLPLALGLLAARGITVPAALIVPATLFLFLGRFAAIAGGTRVVRPDRRRVLWTVIYFGVSAGCLVGAILLAEPENRADAILLAVLTGALGVANAVLVLAGWGRNLGAESLAMGAIAGSGPLVVVLAGGPLRGEATGVGLLCLAYFLSALVFVRTHRLIRDEQKRRAAVVVCVIAHAGLVAMLWVASRTVWLPAALPWAFVPPLVRMITGLLRPARNLRVLGWREMAVAASFLILSAVLL